MPSISVSTTSGKIWALLSFVKHRAAKQCTASASRNGSQPNLSQLASIVEHRGPKLVLALEVLTQQQVVTEDMSI